MQIEKTKNKDAAFQEAICAIEERVESLKKRLNKPIERSIGEGIEDKNESATVPKYKSFMKVASLLFFICFVSAVVTYLYVPDVYHSVVVFLKEIDPLAIFRGGRPSDLNNFVTK